MSIHMGGNLATLLKSTVFPFQKHDLMEHIAHQAIVMNFLLELAKELKYSPQAPQLISMFFEK